MTGPFIVIGMGRSGTSYLGSLLDATGIAMGAELKPADEHNARGYFEDIETTRVHERWLERRGLTLASSDSVPLAVDPDERDAIAAYIARRGSTGDRWGVKAPGILFFWDAWRDLLSSQTVLLVTFRHPDAVAASFERYGLDGEHAQALWLQLNKLALRAADGPFEAVFLNFDDRERFSRSLLRVLGPYVETYQSALRHERPGSTPLPPAYGERYSELLMRADAPLA
jgi:hypothetical protein